MQELEDYKNVLTMIGFLGTFISCRTLTLSHIESLFDNEDSADDRLENTSNLILL